jgi:acyl-CoA reductase-like NAD-dependent aldehyde dehydrogenase
LTYRWSSSDEADRVPVEDPATGEVIAVVQGGGPEEVDAAVEAAHRAFETDWRWRTWAERAALLLRGADVLEEHADELALLESRENGKPVQDARQNDISFLIAIFRFFGSLIDKLPTEFYDKGAIYTSTYLEPVGVVGEIIPFNWPPIHTGGKLAPALAVGNTVVIKPSEQAPLTVIRIVELLNTVLPPDVLHLVPGTGQRVGQPLAAHPKVRLVSLPVPPAPALPSRPPRRRTSRRLCSSSAARTPLWSSTTLISVGPSGTPSKGASTTRAKPAPRPPASSSKPASTTPSSAS